MAAEKLGLEVAVVGFGAFMSQMKGMDDAIGSTGKAWESLSGTAGANMAEVGRAMSQMGKATQATLGEMQPLGLAMGAVAAAGTGLIASSAMTAARTEELGFVLNVVGENAGYTAEQLQQYEADVRGMGITTGAARQSLVQMAQAHIDLAHGADLARLAQDAAVIAGLDSSQAFETLITVIQRGSPVMARTMGLNVDFMGSYERLAEQLGITTDELSADQKMQARLNEVMAQGVTIAGTYDAAMGSAGKQLRSINRHWIEAKSALGEVYLPLMSKGVVAVTDMLKAFNNLEPAQKRTIAGFIGIGTAVATLGSGLILVVPKVITLFQALGPLVTLASDSAFAMQLLAAGSNTAGLGLAGFLGPLVAVTAGFVAFYVACDAAAKAAEVHIVTAGELQAANVGLSDSMATLQAASMNMDGTIGTLTETTAIATESAINYTAGMTNLLHETYRLNAGERMLIDTTVELGVTEQALTEMEQQRQQGLDLLTGSLANSTEVERVLALQMGETTVLATVQEDAMTLLARAYDAGVLSEESYIAAGMEVLAVNQDSIPGYEAVQEAVENATGRMYSLAASGEAITGAMHEAVTAVGSYTNALGMLKEAVDGPVLKANEAYINQQDTLNQKIAEAEERLAELHGRHGTVYSSTEDLTIAQYKAEQATEKLAETQQVLAENTDPERQLEFEAAVAKATQALNGSERAVRNAQGGIVDYGKQIGETEADLASLRGELGDLDAQHRESINRIVYDMMVARLATDGWTSAETNLALETARAMGIIDEDTWTAATSMNKALDSFAEGASVQNTLGAILGISEETAELAGKWQTVQTEVGRESIAIAGHYTGMQEDSGTLAEETATDAGTIVASMGDVEVSVGTMMEKAIESFDGAADSGATMAVDLTDSMTIAMGGIMELGGAIAALPDFKKIVIEVEIAGDEAALPASPQLGYYYIYQDLLQFIKDNPLEIKALFDIGAGLGGLGAMAVKRLMDPVKKSHAAALAYYEETQKASSNMAKELERLSKLETQKDRLWVKRFEARKKFRDMAREIREAEAAGVNRWHLALLRRKLAIQEQAVTQAQVAYNAAEKAGGQSLKLQEKMAEHAKVQEAARKRMMEQKAELLAAEEKALALEKQRQDLAFLQEQAKLLDLIREHGLDAGAILGGIEMGIDADVSAIVQAMTRAMEAIVKQAEAELGISSPSKVFAKIGVQMMAGLERSIASLVPAVQSQLQMAVQPFALPGRSASPVTTSNEYHYHLTTQSMMRDGGLQMEFASMEMASR